MKRKEMLDILNANGCKLLANTPKYKLVEYWNYMCKAHDEGRNDSWTYPAVKAN